MSKKYDASVLWGSSTCTLKSPNSMVCIGDKLVSVRKFSNSSRNWLTVKPFSVDGGGRYTAMSLSPAFLITTQACSNDGVSMPVGLFWILILDLWIIPIPPCSSQCLG